MLGPTELGLVKQNQSKAIDELYIVLDCKDELNPSQQVGKEGRF